MSKVLVFVQVVDYKKIFPGSKRKHFRELHEMSGIPYDQMIFFDDWTGNTVRDMLALVPPLRSSEVAIAGAALSVELIYSCLG